MIAVGNYYNIHMPTEGNEFPAERKVPFSKFALCIPPHRMSGAGDCLIDAIEKMLSRNVLLSFFSSLSLLSLRAAFLLSSSLEM